MTQTIDVSGLPQPVVADIERLVTTLRSNLGTQIPVLDPSSSLSMEEFDRILDEISEGLPPLPVLPADFSREDLYCDHD